MRPRIEIATSQRLTRGRYSVLPSFGDYGNLMKQKCKSYIAAAVYISSFPLRGGVKHLENGAFVAAVAAVGDCANEPNDLQSIRLRRRGLRPRPIQEGRRDRRVRPRVTGDGRPESEGVGHDDVGTFRLHVGDLKVGRHADDLAAALHAAHAEVPREGGGDLLAQCGELDVAFGQEALRLAVELDQ